MTQPTLRDELREMLTIDPTIYPTVLVITVLFAFTYFVMSSAFGTDPKEIFKNLGFMLLFVVVLMVANSF